MPRLPLLELMPKSPELPPEVESPTNCGRFQYVPLLPASVVLVQKLTLNLVRPVVRTGGRAMKSDVPLKLWAPPIWPAAAAGPAADTLVPLLPLSVESKTVVPAASPRC